MTAFETAPLYQVDAFSRKIFGGNPAGVCPLLSWPKASVMQKIAAENNLPETAFFIPQGDDFALRWFTPVTEVDLCGHATLATAHVLFHEMGYERDRITFRTNSGDLLVDREEDGLMAMNFPKYDIGPCEADMAVRVALPVQPRELHRSLFYLAVYDDEEVIRQLEPELPRWRNLDLMGVIITAPGKDCDFVSRFFAPKAGIDEDPVTGSAHCVLAPFWAERLKKTTLNARQLSRRGGSVLCKVDAGRVWLCGHAVTYLKGEIRLETSVETTVTRAPKALRVTG